LVHGLRDLGLDAHSRVIVHASLSALGPIAGGVGTLLGALLSVSETLIAPTFTYRAMVTPREGPFDNALNYHEADNRNAEVEFFRPSLPADPGLGILAETLRRHPDAVRSEHPLLSFAGVNAQEALASQTIEHPWAPIQWLTEFDGDMLLIGLDHKANVSLHYAEQRAERRAFIRWALTPQAIVTCPGMPGCSDGFEAIASRLEGIARYGEAGTAQLQTVPLRDLVNIAVGWIRQDPRALLCDRIGCERCAAVRAAVRA
jgi:aminoglycoside 3-N-acetyltransferase